jgi:hypothetical protein
MKLKDIYHGEHGGRGENLSLFFSVLSVSSVVKGFPC